MAYARGWVNRSRVTESLVALCGTDSAPLREGAMAERLRRELSELGVAVEEDDAGRQCGGEVGNLIGRLPARGDTADPPLLLSAHMDRVAGGIGVRPIVEDGVVKSDGSTILGADDAAGLAAILEALRVLNERKLPHPTIEIAFTIGEEVGLRGAKALDTDRLQAKLGYVLDASGPVGHFVVHTPTQYSWTATFRGRAAHAGVAPEAGISAIAAAALAIAEMPLGRIDAETTANVGAFDGGGPTNVVPARAIVKGECRSRDPQKAEQQLDAMLRALEAGARRVGAEVEVQAEKAYDGFRLPEDAPVVQRAAAAARAAGLDPRPVATGGGSDANVFNRPLQGRRPIPTAVLCVGYQRIHSHEEWMPIDALVDLSEFVLSVILA
ncbi:MAG TPA: M20/M25/M40 family metallo-hydrolase [Limnochordia bacterium]